MINLFEMMQKAQGGQAVMELARQFGLTPKQSEAAVDALLPAFTLALRQQLKNPQAWPLLMAALSVPPAQGSTPFQPFSPQALQQGQQLMGALFGSPQLGQQIAAQGAAMTGLNTALMQQMMPAMAAMLSGGAWQTFGSALANAMQAFTRTMGGQAPAPASSTTLPMGIPENWGEIMGELMGGPREPKAADKEAEAPNMFDPAGIGPLLARMMERAAESATRMAPDSGGEPASPAPDAAPAPEPAAPPSAQPAATASQPGPAEAAAPPAGAKAPAVAPAPEFDAFSRMVETGREVQQQHLRNLQAIMAPFWGGSSHDNPGGGPLMAPPDPG